MLRTATAVRERSPGPEGPRTSSLARISALRNYSAGGDPAYDSGSTGPPNQQVIRFEGQPGLQNPKILNSQELADLNRTLATDEFGRPMNALPPEGF